jgi:branched-subunit amino acid ABC-type transport system permease component
MSINLQALSAQLLVGLINGSFYALLSLGLAVIFGMLNIINFAHGAVYMMGAFRGILPAQSGRHRLLAGADPGAAGGRRCSAW